MYTYNQFKALMKQKIGTYLETEERTILSVDAGTKISNNNQLFDSFSIKLICRDKIVNSVPEIDVLSAYTKYRETGNFDAAMVYAASKFNLQMENIPEMDISKFESVSYILNNCFIRLVNRSTNENLIDYCPHKSFLDLEQVYRVMIYQTEDGMASYQVTNDLLERTGISPEVLYEAAYKNTREKMPVKSIKLSDYLRDKLIKQGMDENKAYEEIPDSDEIILSNDKFCYGATSIIYPDVLQEISEEYGCNFAIIPSTVNQCMVTQLLEDAVEDQIAFLSEIVREVNISTVNKEEQLSNEVYFYDKSTRQLSMVAEPLLLKETIEQETNLQRKVQVI